MFTLFWIGSAFVFAFTILYRWLVENFDYFVQQDIPGPKPVPLFGTWWGLWKRKLFQVELERYSQYGRIYGTFDGRKPNLFIAEPKILRRIFITDFDSFVDRRNMVLKNEYLNHGLSALRGDKWKVARAILAPAFGLNKIRRMNEMMIECAETLISHLSPHADKDKRVNLTLAIRAYTMDIIASCAFGTKLDSLRKPNDQLVSTAAKVFSPSSLENPIFTLMFLYPEIFKALTPMPLISGIGFLVKTSQDILNRRRSQPNKEKRDDFLDLLIEASENETKENNPFKDDVTLVAQVLLFILAGFDTTALTISLTVHELAVNPEIQAKLRTEIREHMQKYEHICYDLLHELPYLDQCISETLRMYPPSIRTERMCNRDFESESLTIPQGSLVTIPIFAIHHDPEFYPDPNKYDPRRFSHEEKNKRDSMVYLPFGSGPRSCIGMRFAIEEIKLGLCHLLTNFNFFPIAETTDPPEFKKSTLGFLQSENLWVGIERLKLQY